MAGEAREKAAGIFGVNERYISDAKRIKELDPAKFEQIKSGEKTLTEAKREVTREQIKQKIATELVPRISFTGDGKMDSVCTAWMVWEKRTSTQQIVVARNPKFYPQQTSKALRLAESSPSSPE